MKTINPDLQEALAELVLAADAHSQAMETFLRASVGGDPDDEAAIALENAHAAVADSGQEVARIARMLGIKPWAEADYK